VVIWPAVGVVVALLQHDPPNYDMPGFGRVVWLAIAVLALIAWFLGRGLRALAIRRGWYGKGPHRVG
jgi:hypothetical protein